MQPARRAFTLVELLIVVAIIGLLVQLILPAVEHSREAARKTQCSNNLRQIGVGVLLHEGTFKHFPAGGWGYLYVGDPDRGNAEKQPGGWIYNTLPFLEQANLHDLSKGLTGEAKLEATTKMLNQPVSFFNCPSRRLSRALPVDKGFGLVYVNYRPPDRAAKSDYAGNAGDFFAQDTRFNEGPPSYAEADRTSDAADGYWIDTSLMTGVFYQRSTTRITDVIDGLSNTYLAGEKYVDAARYIKNNDRPGDDQSMYVGADEDIVRWAGHFDKGDLIPRQDKSDFDGEQTFGSAHPTSCQFVFCDGSVRSVDYAIDGNTHRGQANRHDQFVTR